MKSKNQSSIVRPRLPGFTLVELLVVIVIVAALASITIAVVTKATNSAYKTKAMSNMKQLSNLAQTFSADNNNILMDVRETSVNGHLHSSRTPTTRNRLEMLWRARLGYSAIQRHSNRQRENCPPPAIAVGAPSATTPVSAVSSQTRQVQIH